ncbi:MAG TPA: hypothetical protein RMH85_03705 [Polyangiaceae bacterium LLY-WYZ-15_(1-7)]|nr:hypothetical protein [Myxococcales bacterium]MAT28427.1 hypothetical protein [Sandaracinus sp.]HJK95332.1 hypothetical protein [Polyangiaceae bacterium LLY-WYZ-15_(1-7)]MBJ70394.1 hypothetical protein [Sandaracinus sp.]HJL03836.1 hypothetical protein [Polyangiaceae bacterium LLY-WYZ-15_(1-7)]
MHRTTRSLAALAFALAALAAAPARADVVVEDLQTPPGVDQWERAPQGPPPPRSRAIATLAFYGSGVRPRALNLRLVDPEVALVDGLALPPGAFADRANQGGFTYGAGYRPLPWLRLPEIRLSFGGGKVDGSWTALQSDEPLEARVDRHFAIRLEALAGVEHDFGPITPFLRGYAAIAVHTGRAAVRHGRLGDLGHERLLGARGELGLEMGVNVMFGDEDDGRPGLMLAYRRGLVGSLEHGVIIGLAIQGD